MDEIILKPNPDRYHVFPLQYPKTWNWYKIQQNLLWRVEEIKDLKNDKYDYENKLTPEEQHFIDYILAFFASADGLVNENISVNFYEEVQIPEIRQFYATQEYIEAVHNETYGLLIEEIISDKDKRKRLHSAIRDMPIIAKKIKWAEKWMDRKKYSFAERIVAFAVVEGVSFSGAFCAIFWLRNRNIMLALGKANQFISRDEGIHRDFACHIYRDLLVNKLDDTRITEIVSEMVDIEIEFITEALPVKLIGMNKDLMIRYIKSVADHLVVTLGHSRIYKETNPFPWMETISLSVQENNFEQDVTTYSTAKISDKIDITKIADNF